MERRLLLSGYALSSIPFPPDESGARPGNLVVDAGGDVYGTTDRGGASDAGTIFEIPRGTGTIRTIASFNGADGAGPDSLVVDAGGTVFGTTQSGGAYNPEIGGTGTVFKIETGSQAIQVLASFQYWYEEHSGLTLDANGNVYGNTAYDGPSYPYLRQREVFTIGANGGAMQTVASVTGGSTSASPRNVTLDAAGNLYGTYSVPEFSSTDVFQIRAGSGTLQTLTSFHGDGGAVIADAQGNLYGTTYQGGTFNHGTVFTISHGSDTVRTIASFDNTNGSEPYGLKLDGGGNLYGATAHGGSHGYGTVFKISQGSEKIQTLFDNNSTSTWFALDQSGNLYGTTENGGKISKLTPPLPGDVNGNRTVEFADLLTLAQNYGRGGTADQGDLDGDGSIEFDDLLTLAQYYGRNEPAGWVPTPYSGHPFDIATDTIEAENFDLGSDGLAYHDTTPKNVLGAYRNSGVDVGAVSNASDGYAVGYTYPGEWLAYSITTPAAGFYTLQARVANYKPGGTFHVEIDGQNVTGTMTVPDTGPWDTWQTISSPAFSISAGNHQMRVVMDSGGYWGNIGDFDTFRFAPAGFVVLDSQSRFIMVSSDGYPGTPQMLTQTATDFGPFTARVSSDDFPQPVEGARQEVTQNSTISVDQSGLEIHHFASADQPAVVFSGLDYESYFDVQFTLLTAARYTATYSSFASSRYSEGPGPGSLFTGPGAPGTLQPPQIYPWMPPREYSGVLQPGRFEIQSSLHDEPATSSSIDFAVSITPIPAVALSAAAMLRTVLP